MKNKELWKGIIQIAISILTAALTALGTASCLRCLRRAKFSQPHRTKSVTHESAILISRQR